MTRVANYMEIKSFEGYISLKWHMAAHFKIIF